MNNVNSKLQSLQSTFNNFSRDYASKMSLLGEIVAVNSTDVSAGVSAADQLASITDDLDARRSSAVAAIRSAADISRLVAARLTVLNARLEEITTAVGTSNTAIAQLQADVQRALDQVRRGDWNSVAQQVRASAAEYQTWIDSAKQRRDNLRSRLARMSALLAMFT